MTCVQGASGGATISSPQLNAVRTRARLHGPPCEPGIRVTRVPAWHAGGEKRFQGTRLMLLQLRRFGSTWVQDILALTGNVCVYMCMCMQNDTTFPTYTTIKYTYMHEYYMCMPYYILCVPLEIHTQVLHHMSPFIMRASVWVLVHLTCCS